MKAIESCQLTDAQEAQIERESMRAAMENGLAYWEGGADAPKYALKDVKKIASAIVEELGRRGIYEFLQGKPENWFNRNHIRYCGSCEENIYLGFEWFHEAERSEYCPFCGERI